MSGKLKTFLNFAVIFGTLAVVLLIGLNGKEIGSIAEALQSIELRWIVLCALAYTAFVLLDSAALWSFVRRQGYRLSYGSSVFISAEGTYYSDITPGASGGQPMQVFLLKERGIPIGVSSAALTVKFFCFQLMLQVIGTILWFVNRGFVAEQLGPQMWILIIGYSYNFVCVGFVLLMALNRRLVGFFIERFIRIGTRLRICKDPDASRERWQQHLATFHEGIMMLKDKPFELIVQLLLAGAQIIVQNCITFFIYHAFHLEGVGLSCILTMGVIQFISAAYMPMPGASGAQEGVFAVYFSGIFPDDIRLMALLLWRFFTYYAALILGVVLSVGNGLLSRKKQKMEE